MNRGTSDDHSSNRDRPWHQPGKWLVNSAYWDDEAKAARPQARRSVRFIDCTVSEGDDCVGHQLNWNTRLGVIERLDAVGVGEITMPSHITFSEERDLVKACRRIGIRTPLVAKGPGRAAAAQRRLEALHRPPHRSRHRSDQPDLQVELQRHDFATSRRASRKEAVVEAIGESIAYMKRQQVRVVPWMEDCMRSPVETACLFFKAMADAGADGVYVVDSRGNSTPLATRVFISRIRKAVGEKCDVYIQHHNDLGVATANAMAAAEGGANWIDASVIGIGDRGGCVALEEAAALFEMYGIDTGIKLDRLYELCRYVQDAYGIALPPWKPIVGANWNKEEGVGHLDGTVTAEATIGIAPQVVGREFEAVIGGKILFGRERSSAHTDDPVFLRELIASWGFKAD